MASDHHKKKMDVKGDRLSKLPDDLVYKILSFIDTKQAIETSALSSRWRYTWTSMPYLNFSSKDFHRSTKFFKFVSHVLSHRNNQIEVSSVRLTFHGKASQKLVEKVSKLILKSSHRVEQMDLTFPHTRRIETSLFLFGSQYLRRLTLTACIYKQSLTTPPAAYELLALTTLNLHCVTLYDDNTEKCGGLFSNCANLKNLTLNECTIKGCERLNISHSRLSNLTLEQGDKGANVDTPQLKNLTIRHWQDIHIISAPNLDSLHYYNLKDPLQHFANLLRLEKADICIAYPSVSKEKAREVLFLLQQLSIVKALTLNMEIIKLLSSFVELITHQPSPFTNLKSLNIYPVVTEPEVTMSAEVKNYLLDGSPGATLTIVSCEEVKALRNLAFARRKMTELKVLLDSWNTYSETSTAHMEQDEAPMESRMATMHEQVEIENHKAESDTETNSQIRKRIAQIDEQFRKGQKFTGPAISMMNMIELILTKIPMSHRTEVQARFSNLCAEADTIMDNVMDNMKIRCDKKPRSKYLL